MTTIKRAMLVSMAAVVLAACAGRPVVQVTPQQRSRALTVLICGGTMRDVAAELALSPDDARRVVRATIKDLMHGLQRGDE